MKLLQSLAGFTLIAHLVAGLTSAGTAESPDVALAILTPKPPLTPRINGPTVFGVRPEAPFRYLIPATGARPMAFSVEGLPAGLSIEEASGLITGSVSTPGTHEVVLRARNALGANEKKFRIVVGEMISLTPAMGWNSWNCWGETVDADKILRAARAMVASGLAQHGWSYINIDDSWQGTRSAQNRALQPNEKFPDMRALCGEIHALGLRAGIYSTPWITSYGGRSGSTSDHPDGQWSAALKEAKRPGKYSFVWEDARQWAEWGFDYLKYDWYPNDLPQLLQMNAALRACGRDIIFSVSNSAPPSLAPDLARLANSWRTTNDIRDRWAEGDPSWALGVSEIGFNQDSWAPRAGPGHWNDPDMLVLGYVGWGPQLRPASLTPDEQYSHFSLWCMLSAPLLLGCDLERLDPFTLSLLTNDEVLAINQDPLGQQAVRVATVGAVDIYAKELEDGTKAVGFFNRDSKPQAVTFTRWSAIGLEGRHQVRDLWRQENVGEIGGSKVLKMVVPAHGVNLYRLAPIPEPRLGQEPRLKQLPQPKVAVQPSAPLNNIFCPE